jgi:HAD superfamily hydrolase (TIGR01509 family)
MTPAVHDPGPHARRNALQALIFDVDGTLADTEDAHRRAFNQAFAEEGFDWHWDVPLYTRLLETSGGKERIAAWWRGSQTVPRELEAGAFDETVARLHARKTALYEQAVRDGQVRLRPGVLDLLEAARRERLVLAIATTTSPANIAALLREAIGADWRNWFAVVEDASTAPHKKPHPQVYLQTLARLGLAPTACLAFEDSSNGLRAALSAGLEVVVTPCDYTRHHDFAGALRVLDRGLAGVDVAMLRTWHRLAAATTRRRAA